MGTQIKSIAPLQAAKVSAVLYFVIGAVIAVPMVVIGMFVSTSEGAGEAQSFGVGFLLLMPLFYAVIGFIFGPIFCWLYNVVAKWTGGIEITIQDTSDA